MKIIISEEIAKDNSMIMYHGIRSSLPFERFNSNSIGSGIVSSANQKYGGFFFTSEIDNAAYYGEWFICKVKISNVFRSPVDSSHPPTVLKIAVNDNRNYLLSDVMDGSMYSDIIVVPTSNINDIKILDWIFVADEEDLFEKYDELFEFNDGDITKDDIKDTLSLIEENIDYLLKIPIFKKYYESKR